MATAGDGMGPYQGGPVGGKFRKRPVRRSAQGTPYDRPPTALRNNNPSLFSKLLDPASRLIYAGADRLFGVFRKRLPSIPVQHSPETIEEPRNGLQEAGPSVCTRVPEPSIDAGNISSISAATQISELENMLKQKTFTKSEIERLTVLLHSRTIESPSDDVDKGDRAEISNERSQLLKLEASTSGPLNKHVGFRENFHAFVSTPVNSNALEEDVASPADLAKAYMGTRPAKVSPSTLRLGSPAPRQDSMLLNNTTILPRTPITSLAPRTLGSLKGLENGLTTPRSRGKSAMYNMARTPYSRGTSSFNPKGIKSAYGHSVSPPFIPSSQPVWGHDGSIGSSKLASKRRSSVLDDIGSGGPVRRIRQKANLLSKGSSLSKYKSDVGSSALQQPGVTGQELLLRNEPEPTDSKALEENGETSRHNLGYASVPTKSSQTASKILEQLDRLTPKEKSPGSRLVRTSEKSSTKLASNMVHGQALGNLEKVDSPKSLPILQVDQKSEGQHHTWLPDARESTSQSKDKDKVEENGPVKFAVTHNVLGSMNGSPALPVRDNVSLDANTSSTLKLPVEPLQKKQAFQMSAQEDYLELHNDSYSNGHVFIQSRENKKPGTSVVAEDGISADSTANVVQTPLLPEVAKVPAMPEFKKINDAISPPKSAFGLPGGSIVNEQKMESNFYTTSSSSSNTRSAVLSQKTSVSDTVASQKGSTVLPTFGTDVKSAEKVPSSLFSANEPSGFKTNSSPEAKSPASTSLFRWNKDDNGNGQKSVNMFGKSESLPSAGPTTASASGIFSFGLSAKNSNITNGTAASSPSVFASSSSFPAPGINTENLIGSSTSHVLSSGIAAAAALSSSAFSTSVPASIFSFGSAIASSNSASCSAFSTSVPTPIFSFGSATASSNSASATKDEESKSNISSTPFAITSFATASTTSATGISSSAAATISQASTAVTQVVPFQFGTSSTSATGIPSSGSSLFRGSAPTFSSAPSFGGSSLFGSSAPTFSSVPSFGVGSAVASTETKSGSASGTSAANKFGSAFSSTPSFGLSSAVASSENKFGSAWQPPKSLAFGSPSTGFAFGASSTSSSSPVVFGSSNAGASTGSSLFSFSAAAGTNSSFPTSTSGQSVFGGSVPAFAAGTASPNNDVMSMEDGMAEDSMQTPSSSVSAFAPTPGPGFMFGSGNQTSHAPSPNPFQASNQAPSPNPFQATNQAPSQNPFQFSGQASQTASQNSFQASGSVEFNAGGSFSLGSGGGDKSGRRILRVKSKNRKK